MSEIKLKAKRKNTDDWLMFNLSDLFHSAETGLYQVCVEDAGLFAIDPDTIRLADDAQSSDALVKASGKAMLNEILSEVQSIDTLGKIQTSRLLSFLMKMEARANFSTDRTVIKENPEKLAKVIAARVKGFGLLSARKLVSGLGTLDNIVNAEPADLDAIFGKGSIKSIHLREYLSGPANVDQLRLGAQSKTKTHKGENNGIEN